MRTGDGATSRWLAQLDKLVNAGEITIRGMEVREIIADRIKMNMNEPFVYDSQRKISNAFRFAEAYWILSGDNRVSSISPYAPSIEYFSDNEYVFQGAYGPKVTEQLRYVVESLLKDTYTRQAVLSIWRESPRDSKDIPCTLTLQFLVRDGRLNCVANMRSSDVWLGLPYDMFNFSCIAMWVALSIGFPLGALTINMGSSHLYSKNFNKACLIVDDADDGWSPNQLVEFPPLMTPGCLMNWLRLERDKAHEG